MKKSSLILMMALAWTVPFAASAADVDEATMEVIDIDVDRTGAVTNHIELPDDDRDAHKERDRDHDAHDANHEQEEAHEREQEREQEQEREEERDHEIEDKSDDHKDDHNS